MTASTVTATARTYAYNGDGLLTSRTQGSTTQFLWDPSSSASRLLVQGGDRIVYGLGPLWVVKADASTSSFARDGGKSVRAEVNAAGVVTASFRYRAYGAISQSAGASAPTYLGYAGQLQDPSGLLYMRARWYDPAVGRFTTRDPVLSDASATAALNMFGYAGANPMTLADPTGMASSTGDDEGGHCGARCLDLIVAQQTLGRAVASIQDVVASATKSIGDAAFGADSSTGHGPNGVTIVNNAGGVVGGFVGLFGPDNTMTLGSGLIVSKVDLGNDPARSPTLRHEYGHIAQANTLGALYIPTYLALQVPAFLDYLVVSIYGFQPVSFHDSNLMEVHANASAGLPLFPSYEAAMRARR